MLISPNIEKNVNLNDISINFVNKNRSYIFINDNEKISKMKAKIDSLEKKNNWDVAKKYTNPFEFVYTNSKNKNTDNESIAKYKPISRSFFKFWEINKEYNIIDNNKKSYLIANLAEGPGGFIESILKIRDEKNINDNFFGITLYNSNKYIPDWNKLKNFNKKNLFLIYGNIYNIYDVKNYINNFKYNKANIVTADGGFDYSNDFNSQEINSIRIIFSEIALMLLITEVGGSFICKIFDIFTIQTLKLLYLLYNYFEFIYIFKPKTSRPANSEKYIICKNFKGINNDELNKIIRLLEDIEKLDKLYNKDNKNNMILDFDNIIIPNNFIKEIYSFNKKYIENQIYFLNKTFEFINNFNIIDINQIYKEQIKNAVDFCKKNNLEYNYNESTLFLTNSS